MYMNHQILFSKVQMISLFFFSPGPAQPYLQSAKIPEQSLKLIKYAGQIFDYTPTR